eukprot:315076-Alexandrium_andersonii.AAC.1
MPRLRRTAMCEVGARPGRAARRPRGGKRRIEILLWPSPASSRSGSRAGSRAGSKTGRSRKGEGGPLSVAAALCD